MSKRNRVAQRFCDFPECPVIRKSLAEQLGLTDWQLEEIGDRTIGDSLDLVEAVMVLEEAYNLRFYSR
jgi:acyl carrier protein